MGARATLESATDIFRTIIVAGCDEWDNPIPSFQAAHLLECTWSDLGPCYEQPPEVLDDLLCEEEGQVYARWQRETNTALQRHLITTEDRIGALERTARRETDRRLRQMDDLRRRRRFVGLTDETRSLFDMLIAELDAENDHAFEKARTQVARIRAEAEKLEESLWRREDVLIEVQPFCIVAWRASPASAAWSREPTPVTRASTEMVRCRLRQRLPARIRQLEQTAEAMKDGGWDGKAAYKLDVHIRRLRAQLNEVRT